jgi:hypothetical protein
MFSILITEQRVFEVDCVKITPGEYDGEKYSVTIKDVENQIERKIIVRFTGSLLASTPISYTDKLNYAMRAASQVFRSNRERTGLVISTDNFIMLQSRKALDDEVDERLIILMVRFFKKYPIPILHKLSPSYLFISSDFDFWKIVQRLDYFEARGIIKKDRSSDEIEYELVPGGYEKLEALEKPVKLGAENRYFQIVPLSQKVKEPFVFVLMPFKEGEMEQRIYFDIIKPTVENELNMLCIRADEETKPGVINNQIFTLIHRAKLVIAETTSRNPNVFYEVGMAHAFNKDVFIFNSSKKNKKLPFDIITNRAVFYEDLKKKIVENLKDHVS